MTPMHADQEQLQRLLHGELNADEASSLRAHLHECRACSEELAAAEAEESKLVTLLSALPATPAAPPDFSDILARAGSHEQQLPSPPKRRRASGVWRRAAVIIAAIGVAGIAYAAPGSPLRSLLQRVAGQLFGTEQSGNHVAPDANDTPAGVRVPTGDHLAISILSARNDTLVVRWSTASELELRFPAGAADISTPREDSLVIRRRADNSGDAVVLELVVPRSAKSVTVAADGIEILAAQLGVARPAISDTGSARIPIGGRG